MPETSLSYISEVLGQIEQPALLIDSTQKVSFLNSNCSDLLGEIAGQRIQEVSFFIPLLGILNNIHSTEVKLPHTIESETTNRGTLSFTISKPDSSADYCMILIKELDAIETKKVPPKDYRQALLDMEKMRTMKSVSAGAAHEINNPLGGIMQSVQVLARIVDFDDERTMQRLSQHGISEENVSLIKSYMEDRRISNFIEIIRDCGERSSRMIRQLLGFCRIKDVRTSRLILNELMETVLFLTKTDNQMRKEFNFRYTKIEIDENAPTIEINADDQTLAHAIFLVLKQLAIKEFERRTQQPDIETQMKITFKPAENDIVALEVQDNGLPFTTQDHEAFAMDYYEMEPENSRLSLPISRYLIEEQNNGKVTLKSNEGGNLVRFEFPVPKP